MVKKCKVFIYRLDSKTSRESNKLGIVQFVVYLEQTFKSFLMLTTHIVKRNRRGFVSADYNLLISTKNFFLLRFLNSEQDIVLSME